MRTFAASSSLSDMPIMTPDVPELLTSMGSPKFGAFELNAIRIMAGVQSPVATQHGFNMQQQKRKMMMSDLHLGGSAAAATGGGMVTAGAALARFIEMDNNVVHSVIVE